MNSCALCPRECFADRAAAKRGACGVGQTPMIARAMLHHWEEPCISGTRGAGAVFFSGCPLRCAYCQNHEISQGKRFGVKVGPEGLRAIFDSLIAKGAHNLDLVSATHFLPAVKEALLGGVSVPVIWNCGGYERPETIRALSGIVDIFLPDIKYADAALGNALSRVSDYPGVCEKAVEAMIEAAGLPRFDNEGMLTGGVLVRHLILPGLLDNTREVLGLFAARFRERALFSLMGQYTPPSDLNRLPADYPALARRVTPREYDRMVETMLALGIEDGYVQELSSAKEGFTPLFDGSGLCTDDN